VILYLDASALVKRYIAEAGSAETGQLIAQAEGIGTSVISRAEVAAALAKSVRIGFLSREEASAALQVFRAQWVDLVRLQLTEVVIARADTLAWEHGLRGYDAVHLAAALFWQETMSEPVRLATFDHQLWQAATTAGMIAWPANLEQFKRNV
jgi:predicted nucleic acid-binding protein